MKLTTNLTPRASDIVEAMSEAGYTARQLREALEDGEYLAYAWPNETQADIESAYSFFEEVEDIGAHLVEGHGFKAWVKSVTAFPYRNGVMYVLGNGAAVTVERFDEIDPRSGEIDSTIEAFGYPSVQYMDDPYSGAIFFEEPETVAAYEAKSGQTLEALCAERLGAPADLIKAVDQAAREIRKEGLDFKGARYF